MRSSLVLGAFSSRALSDDHIRPGLITDQSSLVAVSGFTSADVS